MERMKSATRIKKRIVVSVVGGGVPIFIATNQYTHTHTHTHITTVSLYMIHTPTCSDFLCSHQGVLHLCLAKLHKVLKLQLLKLQVHKTINMY